LISKIDITGPDGAVTGNYRFKGEDGPLDFAGLFGNQETLAPLARSLRGKTRRCIEMRVRVDHNKIDGFSMQHMPEQVDSGFKVTCSRVA
jgi:hypothetical protein